MIDNLLFTIPKEKHSNEEIRDALKKHPEVKFVSLVGIDIGGHDTDEKIPVLHFLKNLENIMIHGVQTDGSSVLLPKIADLNNARVDIIPDKDVNWFVDYNFSYNYILPSEENKLPIGTLRIPSFLVHNDNKEVGARVILKDTVAYFKAELMAILKEYPDAFAFLDVDGLDQIEDINITAATELEFWVKTPDDKADNEQLSTSQVLKEQYWKRTIGPVRTALEKSLMLLEKYGIEVEMGHKELGGVKAKLGNSGTYDHIMEQLEVDWKYTTALQAADNENQVKYIVKDVFRMHGLEVSFMAKPIESVAGSGEHTHIGVAAVLKDGTVKNLFSPKDPKTDFLSTVGFGALMGILKNYEVINPFITSTNDAFNRLKPGFEAPVCIVTSLGQSVRIPSRNRTVLMGLVRDLYDPLSTRFELRSPNPKSNTYLVISTVALAMLDGIRAILAAHMDPKELEKSISKAKDDTDFYLEKGRVYRSEKDVFDKYTPKERNQIFGKAPETVWENISALDEYTEKLKVLLVKGVLDEISIDSYKEAVISQWATEIANRIIPENIEIVRNCVKVHSDDASCGESDLDHLNWAKVNDLRSYLMKDSTRQKSLFTKIKDAINEENYSEASDLQVKMQGKMADLAKFYLEYKRNLF